MVELNCNWVLLAKEGLCLWYGLWCAWGAGEGGGSGGARELQLVAEVRRG